MSGTLRVGKVWEVGCVGYALICHVLWPSAPNPYLVWNDVLHGVAHATFAPAGELVARLAGIAIVLVMPCVLIVARHRHQDPLGSAIYLGWLGASILELASYRDGGASVATAWRQAGFGRNPDLVHAHGMDWAMPLHWAGLDVLAPVVAGACWLLGTAVVLAGIYFSLWEVGIKLPLPKLLQPGPAGSR